MFDTFNFLKILYFKKMSLNFHSLKYAIFLLQRTKPYSINIIYIKGTVYVTKIDPPFVELHVVSFKPRTTEIFSLYQLKTECMHLGSILC